eukprot:GFUD01030981.1.p1 GENE.GFUD01030981.1~~GFUD01030981.1.p1  ORF type:complete len:185 (-),score=62.58 GFUD01030981.1:28-582(-)
MNQIGRAVFKVSQVYSLEQRLAVSTMRLFSTGHPLCNQAMPLPSTDKVYSEKISKIVADISTLNLLEVADLNALLKARLNISDAPVMMAGGAAAPVAAKVEEEEEVAAPTAVQTSFTIKLNKFDTTRKVAIIKEIKNQVEGMNLVQAKKFVESAPAVVRADIAKDEAEKIKEALAAVGGECVIE